MYKTISEAISIYKAINPGSVYIIRETISNETITGTAADLFRAIVEADKANNGNVAHVPSDSDCIEAWAIIEAAYNA